VAVSVEDEPAANGLILQNISVVRIRKVGGEGLEKAITQGPGDIPTQGIADHQ
jgi:hypothetical protein